MTFPRIHVLLLFLPNPAAPLDPDELAQVHRLALARLRELAMDLADRVHASADEPGADVGEIASRFARVARAVRQTIALESRLADEDRRRGQAAGGDVDGLLFAARCGGAGVDEAAFYPLFEDGEVGGR